MSEKQILVTQPFLPPRTAYNNLIASIWENKWLSNNGPLSIQLEEELKRKLAVNNLLFVANGTLALQMSIKCLQLSGEIITTPFSFVATTSSIVWEGCQPIFCDIEESTLAIDSTKIESLITKQTCAILATHVYGNPCNIEAIDAIAKKHNLKVIYDAAHAFGVRYKDKSIFSYGDISICSLHATKIYHSIEGGLLCTNNLELHEKLASTRNFGFKNFEEFDQLGTNAKNSEFHAAMGLVNLKYFNYIFKNRKKVTNRYDAHLIPFSCLRKIEWNTKASMTYSYYAVLFESENLLLAVQNTLQANKIFTRRYFYPSLSESLPYVEKQKLPVVNDCAKRVLCLPLYCGLALKDVDKICKLIQTTIEVFNLEKKYENAS